MVTYIRSDLDFILEQIKIAEAHAAGQPLFGPGGLVPAYNVSWGLRTVDGTYNNLIPGREEWGAADNQFPALLPPEYRPVTPGQVDFDGPGGQPPINTAANYDPSNNPGSIVMDPSLRTISNLIVDQTLDNPSAIMVALKRAGAAEGTELATALEIKAEYQTVKPFVEAAEAAHLANTAAQRTLVAAQEAYATVPSPENQDALDAATTAAAATQAASDLADNELAANRVDLDAMLVANGIEMDGDNIKLTNIAPDEGLSASFNSWFTLFGQFFDHGLDLVSKGNSGTVFIPLQPDDPLYDPTSPTNFMVLTRATVQPGPDGEMGTPDDIGPVNTTTSFVDQNQTYTSHPSHQVFLREYVLVEVPPASGQFRPEATGQLLDGANGGLPTWGEIKAQARDVLGIDLTDYHVGNLPLLATDPYGNFIPNPTTGYPQVVMAGNPPTLASGTPDSPLSLVTVGPDGADPDTLPDVTHLAVRTGHAFLDDIAHTAAPTNKLADGDIEIGLGNLDPNQFYDQALLDAHFITGDGRGNENIGLTAVHHVFHSEHNRLLQHTKDVVLATGDLSFINEWLDTPITSLAQIDTPAEIAALHWDGERLFQAAKFGTEMQYQHLVFEEFARKVQPNINVFLVPDGYDVTIDPSIVAEFAHVVYRFGHSMLTESIDRYDPQFGAEHIGLIEGFLNPIEFAALPDREMAGSIVRGMTRQAGNEIDEFVTSALRNNLLGLPLDLATINLARGRDTGVPSLNAARREFYDATNGDALLKPYESWVDFAGNLKNESSIINFIASYGTHALITGQTTIEGKRDAALTIITGQSFGGFEVPTDRLDFLNATGDYAGGSLGGLNNVDLWIGGLAERIMPFGGMLGSTFNFVFEVQMEKLQNGDRFYYLQRLDGLHLFGEMENNSFASMIMRNTDATHLPSDVFSNPGLILEVDKTKQFNPDTGVMLPGPDGILNDDPLTVDVDESADNVVDTNADPVGSSLLTPLVVRNNPATVGPDSNYLRYTGGDHVVLGGTDPGNTSNLSGNDILIAGIGDDTLYGDGGNDNLEGGFGNDIINAGSGDDIVRDMGGDDNIKAGDGNDVVHAGPGLDLVMGGKGQDFIVLGTDMGSEVFAGEGNDFIFGNKNAERILGNEGDDWVETGTFDGAPGDNFDEIFARDEVNGHDVFLGDGGFDEFIAEGGDDVMVGSPGRGKMVGMSGWDWATYKDNLSGVDADFTRGIVFDENPTPPVNGTLDAYEGVEGLSGSRFNDTLTGSDVVAEERLPAAQGGTEGFQGSALNAAGIARIAGLQAVLGAGVTSFSAGEIILGGDGSDRIMGRAGDDIIDGDKWLNVRISIRAGVDANGLPTGAEIATANGMTALVTLDGVTRPLSAWMLEGRLNPGQLQIVREILTDTTPGDIDVAVFQGTRGEYAFAGNPDGTLQVTHAIEDQLDGSDKLKNIERVEFNGGDALNIRVGTPGNDVITGTAQDDLILGLGGNDILNGGDGNDVLVGGANGPTVSGQYADNFNTQSLGNSTGATNWGPDWVEANDSGGVGTGQIRIDDGNNNMRFVGGAASDGAQITRVLDLSAANTATIAFTSNADGLDGTYDPVTKTGTGEFILVQFAADGVNFVTLDGFTGDGGNVDRSYAVNGPFAANAAIRFVSSAISATTEALSIDNLAISFSSVETLNGGNGNDTYSFTSGDGSDVINELANGGAADRISIAGLPVISSLNASDNNTGTQTGSLLIAYEGQQITVNGHYGGTNTQTGVELINFNGATFNGYLLEGDYVISRSDPGNRDAGGVDLSTGVANTQQNFVAGEDGVNDQIIGGALNDLMFGGTGDNDLLGGDGDDLLVGGSGNGDDDLLDGGAGVDTMVGLNGNDTYVVDDAADVVVEAAGANTGTDTVETTMVALSIEAMANVENLTYTGADADPFVGTGNSGNNTITGGDLADTLSGLAGADTLNGGLGADTMAGGADNDVYFVDDAGDVVDETAAGSSGTDRVEASISYVLGANVENLDLNDGAVDGTGNALANVINGNDAANLLLGGAGADNINGGDGADIIDGGADNDTLSGGTGTDTDTIIGGAGNDTIDVGNGNDVLRYSAGGFGNDVVNNFDAAAGGGQDLIDLSALGITTGNFAARVTIEDVVDAGTDDTRVTVRDAGGAVMGTIFIEEVDGLDVTQADFVLSTPGNVINGGAGGQTHTGTGGNDTINALAGNDTVNAGAGNDTVVGGTGNDTVNGDAGDDTFVWNANNATATSLVNSDGRDIVNGGTEGAAGDTFVINGNAAVAETYRVYTRAAWDALPGNNGGSLNAATEIVVTRGPNTDFNGSVIAELREIEEIRINGTDPSGNGAAGGDTIEIVGDFSGTSLRLNTITIDGQSGDDTIDITSLGSAHRIVFRSNGGNDTIIGALRAEDVIELKEGTDPSTYTLTENANGTKTVSNGSHSVTFTGVVPAQFQTDAPAEESAEDPSDEPTDEPETTEPPPQDPTGDDDATAPTAGAVRSGTTAEDVLLGTAGDDSIVGLAGDDVAIGDAGDDAISAGDGADLVRGDGGRDIVFAGAGDDQVFGGEGADIVYGDAGADRLFGEGGNDLLTGGAGDDTVFGGGGDDMMVAEIGDGNDVYFGDDSDGGSGKDTLDVSAATAAVTVNLGTGPLDKGSVSSSQTGNDTLWGVENVNTGSGNDTITASNAVNVMNGGTGNDTFKFQSVTAADGDTILFFEPGDRLDLSGIDANTGTAGDQAFALVTGAQFTAAGQLAVSHETRADGDYTIVQGNVDGDAAAEFTIQIEGRHNLNNSNVTG
jgi:Ca2+-binding RTX toxin-like protein